MQSPKNEASFSSDACKGVARLRSVMPIANRVNAGTGRHTLRRKADSTGSLIRFMCRFDEGLAATGRRRGLDWAGRRAGLDDAQVQEQQLESHIGTRWVAHRRTSQSFLSADRKG